jgi:tRNA modification GTPase
MVEAELDFSDEEDIPGSVSDKIWPEMEILASEVASHLAGAKAGEIVRDGFRIALIGSPNAGKSSLLNALTQRDAAIVSDVAGTTRDIVEVRLDISGQLVLLQDTAGIRDSDDGIEQEGIRRSKEAADSANLVLELRDARLLEDSRDIMPLSDKSLVVWTKSDLVSRSLPPIPAGDLLVSNVTGFGIDGLLVRICQEIRDRHIGAGDVLPTRTRHKQYLTRCLRELAEATGGIAAPTELRTEYLRNAANALGRITGTVDVEDLLGVIFSEFCVGK